MPIRSLCIQLNAYSFNSHSKTFIHSCPKCTFTFTYCGLPLIPKLSYFKFLKLKFSL
jgi:hypothetical protein